MALDMPFAAEDLASDIARHLTYSLGKTIDAATLYDWRMALSFAIRDRIVDPWFEATRRGYDEGRKRVYYLSMEFLIGRLLEDATVNLGLDAAARAAIEAHGLDYDAVLHDEPDAALGNGGLGRLAACFMESMATIGVAAMGYGIRYDHGLFRQSFRGIDQVEEAETWLSQKHAWEFERPEAAFTIGFGGAVKKGVWTPGEAVIAAAYDTPIVGWRGAWVDTLRLWAAKPTLVFDLARFNRGDYLGAAEPAMLAQTISRVLYPDDTTEEGKELRLKQEYFFTAASVRDILRRYLSEYKDLRGLPDKAAIQLNDTHPAIAGPELVRLLMDEHGAEFGQAFETAQAVMSYTNHTLLPEALERWPETLMRRVLPRHMEIISRIDETHAASARKRPDSVKIIDNGEVRMGDLAFIAAHRVNGVSALHTELMKQTVFAGLHEMHPERIVNQTNGVTPRRWLRACNPALRTLLDETIEGDWTADLERLEQITPLADDAAFRERFMAAKRANKVALAGWLKDTTGLTVDPDAMFDIQIKRLHEYKRQLMNVLEVAARWNAIKDDPQGEWVPRVRIFGGKAAPGYVVAKEIIALINAIGATINDDPAMKGRLQLAYPANYNVTMAERLIPAADLSEQISTAGKEASGTGNMKFALNGAPTIGTLDGANVEIRERVGAENFFLFGLTAEEVVARREEAGFARAAIAASPALSRVVRQIREGVFSPDEPDRFGPLMDRLENDDYFLVTADFDDYARAQGEADVAFADPARWARMAVLNTARSGWFTSDRTIRGYCRDVWGVTPAV